MERYEEARKIIIEINEMIKIKKYVLTEEQKSGIAKKIKIWKRKRGLKMTDKKWDRFWRAVLLLATFLFGAGIGGFITSLRYDSDIRTDQLELKAQVDGIIKDKAKIDNLTQQLILHIEQLKLERERLCKLQLKLSKREDAK